MPPTATPVVSNREEDSMNNEPSLSGRTIIGLIYPPPDIRTIVDKTASFVARNGVEFENKIRDKESNNVRFNFLSATDPYNAYYKFKVREAQEGGAEGQVGAVTKAQIPDAVKEAVKKEFIPQKPPPAYEFSTDPATINAYDLDLIRLTAIFVARNGRQFLTQLMTREARNFQFDFLKPAHSNFSYFTKLVEQYTKIIIPANNILDELREDMNNKKKIMNDVRYRVAWEKHQKGLKEKEEQEAERERLAYASIDWHDFVVVQTVDFQPGDTANLPGLCTPKDVGTRILLEARSEMQKAAAEAVEMDMEESDSEDETEAQDIDNEMETATESEKRPEPGTPFAVPLPPSKQKDVIIREGYDPTKAVKAKTAENLLISPLTGAFIPTNKMEEHLRYNNMDSQYKEERERQQEERGNEEPVLAQGAEISKNLGRFAARRTDIFGVGAAGAEQTVIGRKIGEEETPLVPQKPVWDGAEESREAHTRAVQSQISLDQQIHEIQRQHGFIVDPTKEKIGAQPLPKATSAPVAQRGTVRPGPPLMPIPPTFSHGNDAPPAKRPRTEEELEPEHLWLQKVSGVIDLRIQLPIAQEFGLDGSIVALSIEVDEMISTLKQRIQDKFNMPVAKQKLLFDGLFLKDTCSCAHYNMSNHSFVILQVKERGGKNK